MILNFPRAYQDSGASVVALSLIASPYIAAYGFDVETGWGSRYSAPATNPGVSPRRLEFSAANDALLVGTNEDIIASDGELFSYAWSVASGFGSRSSAVAAGGYGGNVQLAESGSRVFFTAGEEFNELAYSSGMGAEAYSIDPGLGTLEPARIIYRDRWVIVGAASSPHARVYDRRTTPPTAVSQGPIDVTGDSSTPANFALSPVALTDGMHVLAVRTSTTEVTLWRFNPSSGVLESEISLAINATVLLFDEYGRLIVGDSGEIRIYRVSSAGTVVELDSASVTGTVRSLSVDTQQGVVFTGTSLAPHVYAHQLSGAGFGRQYSDPATAVGAAVYGFGLMYPAWRPTRSNSV